MRVNEFIEQLKKFPQNAEVMFAPPYRGQPYLPARTAMEILHLRTYLGKSEQTKEFCVVDEVNQKEPSYQDLVDHIRWTQNLWRHGIEIMRKNNLVIASDTPMEKLAFTFYSDLCEIGSRALHLFGEGYGDENYKDQSTIQAQGIMPYPRPYEEEIKRAAREDLLDILDLECEEIKSRIVSSAMGQPLSEESRGRIIGLLDARIKMKSLRSVTLTTETERNGGEQKHD